MLWRAMGFCGSEGFEPNLGAAHNSLELGDRVGKVVNVDQVRLRLELPNRAHTDFCSKGGPDEWLALQPKILPHES